MSNTPELTEAEELRLQERCEEWRFADQPRPSYEQLYQSIIDERAEDGAS